MWKGNKPVTATATRKSLEPWIRDDVLYYPHQIEGIRELARRQSFILADDMGLGKSLQAMTVFAIDVVRGWGDTCLIVCPVTLKGNWSDEFVKFTRIPHFILQGTPVERQHQLVEFATLPGTKALIVNYEQVAAHFDALNAIHFSVAIFDEAHYLKNPKAKRTKACLSLYSTRSFMLTGTPMLNHVNELWPLLHRIDPKRWPKYWSFLNRYAVFGGYKDKQIVGVQNEKELIEHLQGVMLRREKKDVLNLPPVQIIERRVDNTPEQKRLYDEVVNEMRLPQPDGADPQDIENALTKFLRLKEICGTTWKFTGEDHSAKLDLAIEDAVELLANGHKLVVFTQFRQVLERFCARLDAAAPKFDIWELHGDVKMADRQPIVREWTAHKGPAVLACMLQVAGVGLNLTAARHAFFLDKLFVPGLNQQAIDRLHRIGADATQSVQIYEYICRNTIENRINQILRVKKRLFGEIVETDPEWKRKLYEAMMEDEDAA